MIRYYKGRNSLKAIESAFPHHVDMIVPNGGLGKQLDTMYEWHSAKGIQAMHGRGRLSFDHLVGAILHRLRDDNAERLRGLQVEEQLDFACLLHRQVGGFLALENTANVTASEAVGI
jgi:hypothetical protein